MCRILGEAEKRQEVCFYSFYSVYLFSAHNILGILQGLKWNMQMSALYRLPPKWYNIWAKTSCWAICEAAKEIIEPGKKIMLKVQVGTDSPLTLILGL